MGDALGYPVEFMSYNEIINKYGEAGITKYDLIKGKALISDDTQKKLREMNPQTMKMLAAAFIFFFVPYIVEYAVNGLGEHDVDFAYCFVEAELDNIKDLEEREMLAISEESENRKDELDDLSKRQQEEAEKKYAEKAAKDEAASGRNNNSTGTSSGGSSSQTNSSNVLKNGKEGTYFAPLQNVNYNFGVKNLTGGCDNEVYHDAPVAVGAPIYAGMEGIVTYYQYTCRNILYGYGNLAILRSGNGTYITYAHLSEFPEGINAKYTSSCQKRSDGTEPCPSTYCDSTMTRTYLGSKEVKRGQVIGYTGDTGNSTGPHLHVEIHENGTAVCVTDPFQAFGMR